MAANFNCGFQRPCTNPLPHVMHADSFNCCLEPTVKDAHVNTAALPFPPIIDARLVQEVVASQFALRPNLRVVVRQLLLEQLNAAFAPQVFDIFHTWLVQTVAPDGTALEQPGYRLLSNVLLEHIASQQPLNYDYYSDDECFIGVRTAHSQLSQIQPISRVVPLMRTVVQGWRVALQKALLGYWNQPAEAGPSRLIWLSRIIQEQLLATAETRVNLSARQRGVLRAVFRYPDRLDRHALPGLDSTTRAYSVAAKIVAGGKSWEVLTPDVLIVHPLSGENGVFHCKVDGSIQAYASISRFTQSWGSDMAARFELDSVTRVLYEPEGNLVQAQALCLLERHLDAIMAPEPPMSAEALEIQVLDITDTAAVFSATEQLDPRDLSSLHAGLPEWLRQASIADRFAYRSHLTALASTNQQTNGRRFNDDIPSLHDFTANALRRQMDRDQPQAPGYNPDELLLTFINPVGPGGEGTAGTLNPYTLTLTELAVQNLRGAMSRPQRITHARGQLIQDWWMTPDYVRRLIQSVDIGQTYPQWIRRCLLDNPEHARERERLFIDELRVQLPLLALECKIRKRGNFTERGYHCVKGLMMLDPALRRMPGQVVVIRPLAFLTAPTARPDVVRNMFVIGPQQVSAGPHVLYRPLYEDALVEYRSWAALGAAIVASGPLQQSVLDWLPGGARRIYENGGFQRVHQAPSWVFDEFPVPPSSRPALISDFALKDDFGHTLYTEMALALSELADRQTVSNSKRRWASLIQGGWLLFNTLVPMLKLPWALHALNGVVMTVLALQSDLQSLRNPDSTSRAPALIDLLFNIGLTLLYLRPEQVQLTGRVARPDNVLLPAEFAQRRIAPDTGPVNAGEIREGVTFLPAVPVGNYKTQLDFAWFSDRWEHFKPSHLEWLDRNRGQWSDTQNSYVREGVYKGLYALDGKWHALVEDFPYQVGIDSDGVFLVNPRDPSDKGPRITGDDAGVWRFSRMAGLRGGGDVPEPLPRGGARIKRINELRTKMAQYNERVPALQAEMDEATRAYAQLDAQGAPPAACIQALERCIRVIEQQQPQYVAVLDQLLQKHALLAEDNDHVILSQSYKNMILLTAHLFDSRVTICRSLQEMHPQVFRDETQVVDAALFKTVGYRADCLKIFQQLEGAVKDFQAMQAYLEKLRGVPKSGFREALDARRRHIRYEVEIEGQTVTRYRSDVLCRSHQLVVLRDLVPLEPAGEDRRAVDEIVGPLYFKAKNQSELEDETLFSHSERLEILNDVREHYAAAEEALSLFLARPGIQLDQRHVDNVKTVIKALDSRAEDMQLEQARALQEWLPAQPGPSRVPQARRKIVRTRNKGLLIGTVRASHAQGEPEIVDIGERPAAQPPGGISTNVLTAYKQMAAGQWVELQTPQVALVRPYGTVRAQAATLLKQVSGEIHRVKSRVKRTQFAPELYGTLDRFAHNLDRLVVEIKALHPDLLPVGAPVPGTPEALIARLESAATLLRSEGLKILRSLPPSSRNVGFLLDLGEVQLVKINQRIAMTGERQDFVQEYEVQDRAGQVLWYAHVHYAQAIGGDNHPRAAHFKLPEQRMDSKKSLEAKAGPGQKVPEVYYGKITEELFKEHFLPKQP